MASVGRLEVHEPLKSMLITTVDEYSEGRKNKKNPKTRHIILLLLLFLTRACIFLCCEFHRRPSSGADTQPHSRRLPPTTDNRDRLKVSHPPPPASPWIWYVYNMELKLRTVTLTNIDYAFLNRLLYGYTVSPSVRPSRVCLPVCLHVRQNVFGRTMPSRDDFSRLRRSNSSGKPPAAPRENRSVVRHVSPIKPSNRSYYLLLLCYIVIVRLQTTLFPRY